MGLLSLKATRGFGCLLPLGGRREDDTRTLLEAMDTAATWVF